MSRACGTIRAMAITASGLPMQRRQFLTVAAPSLALGGCGWVQDHDHAGADAPAARVLGRPVRTAWVLSSGGPRGFAHVGVLKALHEIGLRPDLVVGASIGSLIGCLYAGGMAAGELERLAMDFSITSVVRPSFGGAGNARVSAAGIVSLINQMLGDRALEQLPIATAVVAMQQGSREVMAFTHGNPGIAVQASCAVEGTLAPVRIRGALYVDPDLGTPMPVRVALGLGATRVLAVDVSAHENKAPTGAERYRAGDLRKRALTEPETRAASFTLHPEFSYYVNLGQAFREQAVRAGYEQTINQAAALRAAFAAG